MTNKILNCIKLKKTDYMPIWFMRQAGRYLPEFRKIRNDNKDFIKLCLNTDLSSKITLQPLKRFELDAAIMFSDILIVPYALGQKVKFTKNFGPILSNFNLKEFLKNNEITFTKKLLPIYKSIKNVKKQISKKTALISFVGAPWTLIIYMFNLKIKKNIINFDKLLKKNSEINIILNKLNEFLCIHIKNQIEAGAEVIQIFDSWAGLLPNENLYNFCYYPNQKLVNFINSLNVPVICFPKGIKKNYSEFNKIVKPNCLNIDPNIDINWAINNLNGTTIQGGMDPLNLLKDDADMLNEVDKYLNGFKNYPYIFNLGHGILPNTDPEKIKKIIERVRLFK